MHEILNHRHQFHLLNTYINFKYAWFTLCAHTLFWYGKKRSFKPLMNSRCSFLANAITVATEKQFQLNNQKTWWWWLWWLVQSMLSTRYPVGFESSVLLVLNFISIFSFLIFEWSTGSPFDLLFSYHYYYCTCILWKLLLVVPLRMFAFYSI